MMQTAVQLFDSRTTELYPEAHGCILLVGCLAYVLGEIHPCAHESQPGISNSFPEDLYIPRRSCHHNLRSAFASMSCSPPGEKDVSLGRIMTLYSRNVQIYYSLSRRHHTEPVPDSLLIHLSRAADHDQRIFSTGFISLEY